MGMTKSNKHSPLHLIWRDFNNVTLDDYMMVRTFFKNIGYDTNVNINKQFCKKYGLEYKSHN